MAKIAILPLGKNVLIQVEKAEKKTESGLFIPDTASEKKPQRGKVVAIGDSEKIRVKKGQQVIFKQYAGSDVKVDGIEYLIVEMDDILAVIEE